MPVLDKHNINSRILNSRKIDACRLDAFRLDGLASGGGGFDSYVKALLHFNGEEGGQTFTDETGRVWTAYGSAITTRLQKVFGTASGYFNSGYSDYITTSASPDFNLGSGDFTIDFWAMRTAVATVQNVFGQADAVQTTTTMSVKGYFNSSGIFYFRMYSSPSGTAYTVQSNGIVSSSVWHHFACVRYGSILNLYIDGVLQTGINIAGVSIFSSSNKFSIGCCGESNAIYFSGWIDEFRFSKGIARWTANFTPPTMEYAA